MFEQELKKALHASRPVPPEGFDGRSDRQIAQLTRKEGIHVKKFSVLMIAAAVLLILTMATALAAGIISWRRGLEDKLQVTEDIVGPYELHDFFLFHLLRYGFTPAKLYLLARKAFKGEYDDATIKKWLRTFCRRFFAQQFKRSCLPDGPKVGSVSLSPRGDWRMPSDASSRLWLAQCDEL